MALSLPGTWADLLWTYFGPQMRTGNPFYLAVDSTLIHSLAVMEEPSISIGDALSTFNYACQLLLDKKSTRALLHDVTLKPLQSKFYSTAICLAAQQVLVVEQMLDRDEYSSRAYFPWYRRTLDIHLGNRNENPLAGSDFQRIWSTLRSEIQTMPGSSPASITFKAGRGVDLNRNLPFSQALFTQQDLSFIHTNVQGTLQKESDESIIKILHRLRANFKRRAKELISKASSDERLRQRLCEQIKSFETTTEQQEEISNRTRAASNLLEWLVAYRDLDNWIDQIYCILIRSELKPIDEPPSEEFLSALIAKAGMVPFVQRDDHYRQVTHTDPFVPYDAVMLLVLRNNLEGVTKHFSQNYPGSKLTTISTNLPEQYLLVDCGELPHSLLFDPQGRMSASSNELAIVFLGGINVDARSNTFLTGYPPTEVLCCGEQIAAHAKLTVNSVEITLDAFLRKLQKAEKLSSYVIEFFGHRTELTISPVNLRSKAELLLGFALDNRKLAPIVTPLNENQPALRGTILIDEPVISENALVSLSSSDLLALTSKGQRKMISDEAISILEEAINQSKQKQQLVQIVLRDLSRTKSVPIHALQAPAIRALLKESVRR